jgi:folate-binding protein YgfZ
MLMYALLSDRGILRVGGKDRFHFLQGLVTNDIYKLNQQKALYSLLLSPQGKYQYDFFVTQVADELWLDVGRDRLEDLKKRLSLFKLKSEVTIDLDLEQPIFACWEDRQEFNGQLKAGQRKAAYPPSWTLFDDPRLSELGTRFIGVDLAALHEYDQTMSLSDLSAYQERCLCLGIPGAQDLLIDKAIPLESGMDELHAIDWDKGCYMGQELTARTRYRGLVRKRLIPCEYSGGALTEPQVIQAGQEVGEIRSFNPSWVMVLLRLEALMKSDPLQCGSAVLTPKVPYWMTLPDLER